MHSWALFSCSSLITLTTYNLAQLPKDPKPGPEPEPDASDQQAAAKFSLDTQRGLFADFETTIAQPSLPAQPQLSKLDELPGYQPALYDPARYPVQETDLVASFKQANGDGLDSDQGMTYRADAVAPLPGALPRPSAIATAPPPAVQPQPEAAPATPGFARAPVAQVPTTAPPVTAAVTGQTAAPTAQSPAIAPAERVAAVAPDLFAALPVPNVLPPVAPDAAPTTWEVRPPTSPPVSSTNSSANRQSMADPFVFEFSEPPAAGPTTQPDSPRSMDLALPRYELINRYCDRAPAASQASTKRAVCDDGTNELAQRMPDAATAGTPMPGSVESPTRNKPAMGVRQLGNKPLPAAIAGP